MKFVRHLPPEEQEIVEELLSRPTGKRTARKGIRHVTGGREPRNAQEARRVARYMYENMRFFIPKKHQEKIFFILNENRKPLQTSAQVATTQRSVAPARTASVVLSNKELFERAAASKKITSAASPAMQQVIREARSSALKKVDWREIGKQAAIATARSATWGDNIRAILIADIVKNVYPTIFDMSRKTVRRERVPPLSEKQLDDIVNSISVRIAENYASTTISGLKRAALEANNDGVPPIAMGARLRESFGMDERYVIASNNYRRKQLKTKTKTRGKALRDSRRYSAQLIDSRDRVWGDTETQAAQNRIRELVYEEAFKNGELDEPSKIWVTQHDERVCTVCGPMDGMKVSLGQKFKTSAGPLDYPPAHPNCRCIITSIASFRSSRRRGSRLARFSS